MLDDNLKAQLGAYLERVQQPFEITASLSDSENSRDMRELLQTIAGLRSDKITLKTDGQDARKPSFTLQRPGSATSLRFAGLPLGHEFTSLVLALLWTGGHPPKVEPEVIEQIQALDGDFNFEVYMSLSCHNCPDVVQALSLMAILNPKIKTTIIEGGAFQEEVEKREIMAVPMVFLNGSMFASGKMTVEEIVAKLDTGAAARDAAKLSAKAAYDVLIVGGGPAGAAAAVYAARKGIRTGVVAERFGGQVNDTLGIENYISVLETDGPKFAAALEAHTRAYDVDIMNLQRAEKLIPAAQPGGLVEVQLANGAVLKSKSVIISTGARWRNVNVPGEAEYRNKGVAYCPHCDGPLFKGKRVAVIGGGNSGVEAAIDLAGVVAHVTLIEFAEQLKADAVLVNKLKSLPNVEIHTNAQTTEITGADGKVNGLKYKDRATGADHHVALEGVFVQIGLVPNTEWLKGTLELSRFGEIIVDAKGATNVPGVFAAGDCTTVPYKQIVIAAGDGAKAALGAFDHLIRSSVPIARRSRQATRQAVAESSDAACPHCRSRFPARPV
ncbi:MAG: alkyl hydroperoxide reductase subunit F [Aquabacterium sp.]|nr:alkyl hydroperoxide reductase subunit F [Aquabacterium sp.]